ncbi:hypothetical protein HZB01_01265 [Candidatus Woesearchaeota archaeon]|nr:hypothetical protein [Candidatus Woesearchaeota archaeon]
MITILEQTDMEVLEELEHERERQKKNFRSLINKGKLSKFELDELFVD